MDMDTIGRLIGHLSWLVDHSQAQAVELALAVYNTATRLRLTTFALPAKGDRDDFHVANLLRKHSDRISVEALRWYATAKAADRRGAIDARSSVELAIRQIYSLASKEGMTVLQAEFAIASQPASMVDVLFAANAASSMALSGRGPRPSPAGQYEDKLVAAMSLIMTSVGMRTDQVAAKDRSRWLLQIGIGVLSHACHESDPGSVDHDLDQHAQLTAQILDSNV